MVFGCQAGCDVPVQAYLRGGMQGALDLETYLEHYLKPSSELWLVAPSL